MLKCRFRETIIRDDKSGYIGKAAVFIFSAVLHIALFYTILHVKYTYKIFTLKSQNVSAVLVPRELAPPPMYGKPAGRASQPQAPSVIKPGRQAGERPGERGGGGGQPGEQKPAVGLPVQPAGAGEAGAPAQAVGPGGAAGSSGTGFRLVYPKGGPLNLAKIPESPVQPLLSPNRYNVSPDIGVAKLLRPVGGRPGTGGTGQGRGPGGGGTGQAANVPENVVRYDFSPWANGVINKIQTRWSVAETGKNAWTGEVGVNVLILKNGDLLAAEVAKSSHIDVLDEAALKAVRLCAPFPPLPPDFPADRLEMYLVFQYANR